MTTELGRVRLITGTPPCSPGTCVVCGTPGDSDSKFVDFGFDIDFYGVVYFCEVCIKEVMHVLDFVPTELYEDICNDLFIAGNRIEDLEVENRNLKNAIRSLRDLDLVDSSTSVKQSDVVESTTETKPVSKSTNAAKPRSSKSTNESRSPSVRNNDSAKKQPNEFDL